MSDPAAARPPVSHRALCVVHPNSPATGTCSRCGSYVCLNCNVGADGMCAACRERLGIDQFPFTREAWEIGGLVSHAWEAFKPSWGAMIGLAAAIFFLPVVTSLVAGLVGVVVPGQATKAVFAFGGQALQIVVSLALTLGALGVFLDAVRGRPLSFDSFLNGLKRLGGGLLQYLVVFGVAAVAIGIVAGIAVAAHGSKDLLTVGLIAGAVLILPAAYAGLGVMFMQYELVEDPDCGAIEAIRRSWEIARGKRLEMFGASVVAGLVMAAGGFLCGVGALASYPIGTMVLTGLYLALRNGSGLPQAGSRN